MRLPRIRSCRSVLAALAVIVLPLTQPAVAGAAPSPVVTIRVDATKPGRVIPQDFLGLSFEADLLHEPWIDPNHGNVATLLRNLGAGTLRFSANAVDKTAWTPNPAAPVPAWAEGRRIIPDDLTRLGQLAEASGWKVDLGVNLGHYDPASAADQAAAARERIGDSLRTIEIGNEPNVYLLAPLLKSGERRPYTPDTYVPDVRTYRQAIGKAAPGVRIEGPNTAGVAVGNQVLDPLLAATIADPWLDTYIAAFGAQSKYLNQHYYPFINTQRLGIPAAGSDLIGGLPSVDKLMAKETRVKQTRFLQHFTAKARRAGLEPKLSETNSVAKEGRPGVTNSFGASLWTVDYAMTAAREGVSGLNFHNQPADCGSYSLICFPSAAARAAGMARPNPNYYGALMVSRMVGGAILPVTVKAGGADITGHAVRLPSGQINVIVDDLDRSFQGRVNVEIIGGAGTSATIERLTGPSPAATGRARLAGTTVSADGSLAPLTTETVPKVNGRYSIPVNQPSAVLLQVS